uniref:Uncharacterized protein n=1 Tax=Otus sunia TaxID=257818 RepID=A0A8C8E798_9STRI
MPIAEKLTEALRPGPEAGEEAELGPRLATTAAVARRGRGTGSPRPRRCFSPRSASA